MATWRRNSAGISAIFLVYFLLLAGIMGTARMAETSESVEEAELDVEDTFTPPETLTPPEVNEKRPHIVFILADDMGWNDVSFHNSNDIQTPNLDALAYNGVILNNLYTQPVCTPSRAALMTGKYPIRTGTQGPPFYAAEPTGLPLNEKLLPEYLKELGYKTSAIGKWHLGFYKQEYLPTRRGFDQFFGYWSGFTSYYDHITQDEYDEGPYAGYDMRDMEKPAWEETQGIYATDLFTDRAVKVINEHDENECPLFLYVSHLAGHWGNRGKLLEAPQEEIDKFGHILNPDRRTYAAMISKMDESVGRVVDALRQKDMLKDSIVIFMSDNGAQSFVNKTEPARPNFGSNYPLRGVKNTLYEGGVRSASFIWSPMLQQVSRISEDLMHITDWLPTLYAAAGGNERNLPFNLDGKNQWDALTYNFQSTIPEPPRNTILLNIDEVYGNGAIRLRDWKLIYGPFADADGHYGNFAQNIPYDVGKVFDSPAWQAATEIRRAYSLGPVSEEDVLSKREAATVRCRATPRLPGTSPEDFVCSKEKPCLFDIRTDPCEQFNLAGRYANVTQLLTDIMAVYQNAVVPRVNQPFDPIRANPALFQNTWSPWS